MADKGQITPAAVMALIRSRRVSRVFLDEPVSAEALLDILEAGRWATSGGNRRIHRFLVVREGDTLARIRAVSPGILGRPRAIIVIVTDLDRATRELVQIDHDRTTWIDVGTAAMNMMLAAHAIGLGSCPVTSFSQEAVRVILGMPDHIVPELLLVLGHPGPPLGTMAPSPAPTGAGAGHRPTFPPGLVSWEQLDGEL